MSLNDNIKAAIAGYMRTRGVDVVEVTDWEDTTLSDGYCETCYYEYAGLKVYYKDSSGKPQIWTYDDSFSSLINSL